MKKYLIILILIQIFIYVRSPIPNWNLSEQANILNPTDYTIYEKINDNIKIILKKKMYKSGDNVLSENIVYAYVKENDNDDYTKCIGEKTVNFDAIGSHYRGKLGYDILICPKGKFQPYNFNSGEHINNPTNFNDVGDWDLRCHYHNTGYFYLFYLLKNGNHFFFKYSGGSCEYKTNDWIYSYFYDYMYEDGNLDNTD